MQDYSRESLLAFFDYLGDKGLQNKNTVASSKGAVSSMLSILDDTEATDLRLIDMDVVATRFANLKGSKYPPATLKAYRGRTTKAVQDFLRYKENPAAFKVGAGTAKSKVKNADGDKKAKLVDAVITPQNGGHVPNDTSRIVTLNIPIALRSGCIMQMNGIPADLTKAEATKISNIVLAMAASENE
jgi:hypothetical protein